MIDVFYIGLDDPFGFSANNPKKASSLSCDVAATPMLQGSFNGLLSHEKSFRKAIATTESQVETPAELTSMDFTLEAHGMK